MPKLTDEMANEYAAAITEWMAGLHAKHWKDATPLTSLKVTDYYDAFLPPPFRSLKSSIRFSFNDELPKPDGKFKQLLANDKAEYKHPAMTVGNLIFMNKIDDWKNFDRFDIADWAFPHELVHVLQFYMLGVWDAKKPHELDTVPLKPWAKVYFSDYVTEYLNHGMKKELYGKIRFESPACEIERHYKLAEPAPEEHEGPGPCPPPIPSPPKLLAEVRESLKRMNLTIKR
jgi:hypothetical protein